MSVWPADIKPLKDNFSESIVDRVIKSEMEVGPAKTRRRSQLIVKNIKFDIILNLEQVNRMEQFYLDNDSYVFSFTHPRTAQQKSARFMSPFSYVPYDTTMFRSTIELELLP